MVEPILFYFIVINYKDLLTECTALTEQLPLIQAKHPKETIPPESDFA